MEGSDFVLKADLALLAMGFTGPEQGSLCPEGSLKPEAGGRLSKGLYACGDAVSGPSLVVRAMTQGIATAEKVLADFAKGELAGLGSASLAGVDLAAAGAGLSLTGAQA